MNGRNAVICLYIALFTVAAMAHADDSNALRLQTAQELVRVMNLEKVTMEGINTAFALQMKANPDLAPYADVIDEWIKKYLTWTSIAPRIAALYAQTFTTNELREITAFYQTPTGKKTLTEMTGLLQKSAVIGREVAQQHEIELQEMMRERTSQN